MSVHIHVAGPEMNPRFPLFSLPLPLKREADGGRFDVLLSLSLLFPLSIQCSPLKQPSRLIDQFSQESNDKFTPNLPG